MNNGLKPLKQTKDVQVLRRRRIEIQPVIETITSFLIRNDIVLHGDMALNFYLSEPKKIFDEFTHIPVFDGYFVDARDACYQLFYDLKMKEYNYVMVADSLHSDNVFKVLCGMKDMMSLTCMLKAEYNFVRDTSQRHKGLLFANIHLIKSKAYLDLALPTSHLFKWKQIFNRLELLEESKPLLINNYSKKYDKQDELPKSLYSLVKEIEVFVIKNGYPFVGNKALAYHLTLTFGITTNLMKNSPFRYVQFLSNDINNTVTKLEQLLSKHTTVKYVVNYRLNESELMMGKVTIDVKHKGKVYKLISVFDTTKKCIAMEHSQTGIRYASIFYLIHTYYYYLFKHCKESNTDIYHQVMKYTLTLVNSIKDSHFTVDCYGIDTTLSIVKKARMRK